MASKSSREHKGKRKSHSKMNGEARFLITQHNPKSPVAEAFRLVRANMMFSGVDRPFRQVLITSAGPGEGKSTTVANLGIALAQSGQRVLLVDCDLRKPVLHKVFQLSNARGLTNYLVGDMNGVAPEQASGIDGLSVVTSGPLPPNPSELLGSQRMRSFWEEIGGNYDLVLIDSPPAVAVSDPVVLAPQVDAVIMVVSSGHTRRDMLQEAKAQLEKASARFMGVIINRAQVRPRDYHYYYYYSND